MPPTTMDLGDLLQQALHEDRDVTLEKAEGYGYHIAVDGVPITESARGDGGLPWAGYSYYLDDWHRTEEADLMVDELVEGIKGRRARRQNERLSTDGHAAAEGASPQ